VNVPTIKSIDSPAPINSGEEITDRLTVSIQRILCRMGEREKDIIL